MRKPIIYTCYQGHHHARAEYARECDEAYWNEIKRRHPELAKPLATLPKPPVLEQTEAFPDFIKR